ncbi:MAG: hypothetical protein PUJ40_02330 [bacterium]|nr:hypothetical protein [bacterium]
MEKKTNSIIEKALARYKGSLGDSLVLAFTFFLLAGGSLCLGFLGVDFALIGILLIGLPALLSCQLMILRDNKDDGLSNAQAFRGFRLYYSFYFGVYRFWLSLLRSFLVFLLAFLVIGFSSYYIFLAASEEFLDQVTKFATLIYQEGTTLEQVLQAYENSSVLRDFSSIVLLCGFGIAGYWFIHEIARNAYNLYVRSAMAGAPARFANAQFAGFFRQSRRKFYSFYYPCVWPAILLYILGYALGAWLGYRFTGNATYAIAFGFLGSLLPLSFFLPYYFYGLDEYAKGENASFMAYVLSEAESSLKMAEGSQSFSEEELKQLRNDVAEIKKKLSEKVEEDKKEDEKEKGDDQNSSSGS